MEMSSSPSGKKKVRADAVNPGGSRKDAFIQVPGVVVKGHQAASGMAKNPLYPKGTLAPQLPFFKKHGIPLGSYHLGTINIDISPMAFSLHGWDYEARQIAWSPSISPEDFLFSRCKLVHRGQAYRAMVYYPTPETKEEHFQSPHIVEVLAEKVMDLDYGDHALLRLNPEHCRVR